jgi:hypothetical protein
VSSILLNEVEKEGNEGIRMFLRMMLNHIQAFAASSTHDVFVSCFCESGNLLDQWLKYARGGEGYSLGFKFSSTTRIASDSQKLEAGKEPYFRKVVYNEECQRILVQEYLGSILNAIKEGLKTGDVEFSEKDGNSAVVATQAADILLDMMVCFKHPAFEPENEWRLIRITRHDVEPEALRFRESSGELKPYRPMYIYDVEENEELSFPLRSIGFGPKLEPGRTHPTIRLLIQHLAADQHLIKVPTHNIQVYAAGYPLRKE